MRFERDSAKYDDSNSNKEKLNGLLFAFCHFEWNSIMMR